MSVALALAVIPSVIGAQTLPATNDTRWTAPWSPLASRADLGWRIPGAPVVASPLDPPLQGVFWTAGNPAGLRSEISDTRSDYSLAVRRESGGLRRTLDPARNSLRKGEASGWSIPTKRLALLGRAAVEKRVSERSFANIIQPYSSSPLVTLDTSGSDVEATSAVVEGVTAIELGEWDMGAAAGFEGNSQQSIESGLIRRVRRSTTGVTFGVQRRIPFAVLAPYVRWRGRAETTSLIERDAEGVAVELETLTSARSVDILQAYYRRSTERVLSAGSSLGSTKDAHSWLVYAERSALRLDLTSQTTNDPASDSWRASEWSGGMGYRFAPNLAQQATLLVRYAGLRGDGDLARDSAGSIVRSVESSYLASGEVKRISAGGRWSGSLAAQMEFGRRTQEDLRVPIAADIGALTTSGTLQVTRKFGHAFGHASLTVGHYSSSGTIPDPTGSTTSYQRYVVPYWDMMSRPMNLMAVGLGARWPAGTRSSFWTRIDCETVSAQQGPTNLGSTGNRTALQIRAGVTSTVR